MSSGCLCQLTLSENSKSSNSIWSLSPPSPDLQKVCIWRDPLAFACAGKTTRTCCLCHIWELLQTKGELVNGPGWFLQTPVLSPGTQATAKSSQELPYCHRCHVKGESDLQTEELRNKNLSKFIARKQKHTAIFWLSFPSFCPSVTLQVI